jgi:hypothetical protein
MTSRRVAGLVVGLWLGVGVGRAGAQALVVPALDATSAQEATRLLQVRMRLALGHALVWTDPAWSRRAIGLAQAMLTATGRTIDRPQTVLLVDRAASVQRLWVVVATPDAADWAVVGAVRVSTGKPGKLEHFKTPVGLFDNSGAILGYRAQGTFNENHIRGNGLKGMRVWDFGWQTTQDWRTPDKLSVVRLEMHATDPTFLEGRLGRPDSEACIRIPASFNTFIDQAGLIDAQLLARAPQDRAIAALLPKDREPTPLAGELVIVVDSAEPATPVSDPVEAVAINQRFADWLASQTPAVAGVPGAEKKDVAGAGPAPATRIEASKTTP